MNLQRIKIIAIIFFATIIELMGLQKTLAQNCVIGLGTYLLSAPSSGDYAIVDVYCSPVWCDTWSAYTGESWIYVNEDYENQFVYIEIYENESEEARNGSVYIDGHSMYIQQAGACDEPAQPESIYGAATVCSNSVVVYSIEAVTGATSYTWSLSNGGTILNGQGSTTIEASFPNTGGATVSVYASKACGNGTPEVLNINIILGSSQSLENQDTIRLGACPILTGNQDIAARDEIILTPGFSYTGTSGTTFTARIDRSIIRDAAYLEGEEIPDPDDRPLNTSLQVGSTAGSITTTALGGASYTIPIFSSPGTNGVQPSLSLQYNSQSGNGLLGWGWNLGGLSSISRMVKPYYIDNEIIPINMVAGDEYAIDGNRLVLNTGTHGSDGSKYKTESETFTETVAHGSSGYGPQWFEVINKKDSSVMEYGHDDNAYFENSQNTRLAWLLTKYKDINGNYIKYNYLKDPASGQTYMHSIEYTSNDNENLQPYNEIIIQYERRSDSSRIYQAGVEISNSLLISKIFINCQGSTIRTYTFDYTSDQYSFLVEVKETTGNGDSYNSTIVSWGVSTSQFSETTSFDNNDGNKFYFGDFNGDGKDDFVRTPNKTSFLSTDKWELYLNQNGTTFTKSDEGNLSDLCISLKGKDHFLRKNLGIQTIDFDGNGLDDIVMVEYREIFPSDPEYSEWEYYWDPPFYNYQYKVYLSDGQHLNYNQEMSLNLNQNNAKVIFGDFNGDGKTNIYAINENDALYNYEFYPIDFNGDGKTDIMAINNNESFDIGDACIIFDGNSTTELYHSGFPTKWHRIFPGDFNGDGKTDVLTWSSSYGWQITYSNGNGFVFPQVNAPMTKNIDPDESDYDNNYSIGDYNGDGKSDIFEIYSNFQNGVAYDSEINVYYSNGNDFVKESHTFDEPGVFQGYLNFGDLNGDGNQECFYKGYYLDPATIISMHPDEKKYLIHSITNGYNLKTAISYKPLTDNTIYTKGSGAIFPIADFQKALYVVSSVTTNDGISETNTTNYSYEGAKLHQQGKGLLEFSKLTTENLVDLTKSETSFSFGTTFYNVYPSNIKQYVNSTLVSETTNTPDVKSLDGGERYFPYIPLSISEDKVKNTLTQDSTSINSSCNITKKITKAKTSTGTVVSQITGYFTNYNGYGKPQNVMITSKRGAGTDTISRSKTYSYNSNGSLHEETDIFGSSPSVVKSFTYDDYGNVLTSSVSSGSVTRTNTFTYETDGYRFVKTKANPISQTISFTNDPVTGNILEETDHTGLKTSYTYDSFGRKTETRFPDGQTVHYSLNWSLNTVGIGELYYTSSESAHKPTVITYYDYLGRELRSKTQSFDGTYLVTDKNYDSQGRLKKSYMPYFEGSSADQYVVYSYDNIGRISSDTTYPGEMITSYTYDDLTTTIEKGGQTYEKEYDASGLLYQSTDPGGTITYSYNAEGKVKSINSPSGTTTIGYDDYGYQDKLHDLDAGTIDYNYNGFGDLITQVDSAGNQSTMEYDLLGRIIQKAWSGGETIDYNYNSTTGLLTSIESPGSTKAFTYDQYYRVLTKTETVNNNNFTAAYSYDSYGNMITELLNNTITLDYAFNGYGFLDQVSANNQLVWNANSMNKYGQVDNYTLGNGVNTVISNDQNGFLDKIETKLGSSWIQNWDYEFDNTTGNMTNRSGLNTSGNSIEESFTFDDLNRLKTYTVGNNSDTVFYDSGGMGNISTKTDIGDYSYSSRFVHKLESITNLSENLPDMPEQDISYTKFNKISTLTHTSPSLTKQLTFTYGPDEQRVKTVYTENSNTIKTKYFALGNYEKEIAADNSVRELYYISTPTGIAAIIRKTGSQTTFYYVHTDIIGSLDVISNSSGTILERLSFDPWGRRRNPANWTYTDVPTTFLFDRGFTGHEHLDKFDLINMNGRVYDPLLAMFLSPDNYVQAPDFTQNFNRYAYCLNDPLSYTDPDGEFFIPMLIGSGISLITNGIGNAVHDRPFFQGAGQAALYGAIGGVASYGIGQATIGMNGLDKIVNQTFGHGLLGGAMSSSGGGTFGSGFISGAFGSLAATGSGALLSNVNNGALYSMGMVGSGSIIGGIGSEIGGGEFWDGFRNGAISSSLNHMLHDGPPTLRQLRDRINNSRLARAIVKDFYSVSLDGAVVPGFGASVSTVTVNVLFRGPEKGIFITHSPSNSVGFRGGLSIAFQQGRYVGNAENITRSSLYGLTRSIDSDFTLFPFGGWRGYNPAGEIIWRGTSSSFGLSYGISYNWGWVTPGLPK